MVGTKSMSMPRVSIIVPVYKAEAYLYRCVDSILAQTFTDFELLLIDDGSPDRSGEICDEYTQKDSRIRVIHKENGGVSSARQRGLDESIGEYTIHADPDDWMEENMIEILYREALELDADMIFCDYYKDCGGKSTYIEQKPESLDHNSIIKGLCGNLFGACWNKLIRRSIIKEYGVKFPEKWSLAEDQYFLVSLLLHNIKIGYVNNAFYHYVIGENENSLANVVKNTYDYDKMMYNAFISLIRGNPNFQLVKSTYAFCLLQNEFMRHDTNSIGFVIRCLPYLLPAIKYPTTLKVKLMFVFSCFGLYDVVYFLWCRKNITITYE